MKVSFQYVEEAVLNIAETFKYKTKLIVGISRGGLVPAVMLSHKMGIPLEVVTVQLRDSDKNDVDYSYLSKYNNSDVLFVDDINDTGNTIELIQQFAPNANFASIHKKESTKVRNAYYYEIVPEQWIVYPWE